MSGCIIPTQASQKNILGTRKMENLSGKEITIFPIQSGVLEAGTGTSISNYWIATLYSVECFDDIVAEYGFGDTIKHGILL